MYQNLANFLSTFSADYPFLWALLVLVVIAGSGLLLYGFWEGVLKLLAAVLGKQSNPRRSGHS